MPLPTIPLDKANHAVVGSVVYAVVKILTRNPVYAVAASIVAAVAKEVYDKVSKKGTPELMDIVATVVIPGLLYIGDHDGSL